MKYFMALWSPVRKQVCHYQMTDEQAEYYYTSFLKDAHWPPPESLDDMKGFIAEALKNGSEISAPPRKPRHMKIWGEAMSDAELFRRRLKGLIEKDMLV